MARTVDIPLEHLPHIDEHGVLVDAPRERVWDALVQVVPGAFGGGGSLRAARMLGCSETERSGEPGRIGSTIPGFVVARVIKPAALALEGQHRFSRYGLIFSLDPVGEDQTMLRAETRAEFPGFKGKVYRALVIGTNGHVIVVNRLLKSVKKRAERSV